jgi:hypothetical protein
MLPTRQTNLLLSDLMFAFSASAWMPMLVEFGMRRMQLVSGVLWFIGNFITHLLNLAKGTVRANAITILHHCTFWPWNSAAHDSLPTRCQNLQFEIILASGPRGANNARFETWANSANVVTTSLSNPVLFAPYGPLSCILIGLIQRATCGLAWPLTGRDGPDDHTYPYRVPRYKKGGSSNKERVAEYVRFKVASQPAFGSRSF